jgi:hypothetical protein
MRFPISFPIAALTTLVIVGVTTEAFLASRGAELSDASGYLWTACFSFCVALWLDADRKSKAIPAPFEYQAFVFFLWPVVAPYYLFQTRRWLGLLQGVGLILFSCLPSVAALVTYMLVGDAAG